VSDRRDSGPREAITLIPCAACGGEYRRLVETAAGTYRTEICKFCTMGHMDEKQIQAYRIHRGSKPKVSKP